MERGPELASLNNQSTLLYRGHTYSPNRCAAQKPVIQLTYRRNVYQSRQTTLQRIPVELIYRGVQYTR